MIVEILKAHGKWKPGDTPDISRAGVQALIDAGVAKIHDDQTRRDYTPKAQEQEKPAPIIVNNFFAAPETIEGEAEAEGTE